MSSPLSSHELHTFLEIVSTRNISRAAERLGTSQPALSIAVKRLERYFGVSLFLRTRHGVELTKAAVKLASEAKQVMQNLESLRDHVLKQETEIQGLYTIGFHPQIGAYCFSKFGRALLEKSDLLNIKLVQEPSRKILTEVISFNIDFGIVVNPTPHPDLVIIPLYPDTVRFWVKKQATELQRPLTKNEVIICDRNLPQMERLLIKAQKLRKIHGKRVLHSSDLDATKEFVAAGIGIGILPTTVAQKNAANSLFSSLLPLTEFPNFNEKISLIYRADFQKSQAAKYIKDTIIKSLR